MSNQSQSGSVSFTKKFTYLPGRLKNQMRPSLETLFLENENSQRIYKNRVDKWQVAHVSTFKQNCTNDLEFHLHL